jgi:hypothetical protein
MGTLRYIGNAPVAVDTWTYTVGGTWVAGDTISIIAAGKTLVITVGSVVTTAGVAQDGADGFNSKSNPTDPTTTWTPLTGGQGFPEFTDYGAYVIGSTIVVYSKKPGATGPTFTAAKSSTSGTFSVSHTTTGTGPSDVNNTANYDTGALPVNSDDLIIDGPYNLLYNLSALSGVTLASLTITSRFTQNNQIGLLARNAAGYAEYRATEFAISATTFTNYGTGGLVRINFGSNAVAATSYQTGTSIDTNAPAYQLRGTSGSNTLLALSLSANGGTNDVGWAANGETASLSTARQDNGTMKLGSAVTVTTVTTTGGTLNQYCGCTTLNCYSSTVNDFGGAKTTVNILGGVVNDFGTSTYTNLNLSLGGTYNVDGAVGSKTVTNTALTAPCSIRNKSGRLVQTNAPTGATGVLNLTAA